MESAGHVRSSQLVGSAPVVYVHQATVMGATLMMTGSLLMPKGDRMTKKEKTKVPPKEPVVETCSNCWFGRSETLAGVSSVICRRYPEPVDKALRGWCGEWRER